MVPEAQAALEQTPPPERDEPAAEVRRLREAVEIAVALLARKGYSPAAFASLPEDQRCSPEWLEAIAVWRAAGVPLDGAQRVVLRCTSGDRGEEQVFPSPELALEAAIRDIEDNRRYPDAIEMDGRCLMDRASILRAWEDRHDPG